MMNELEEIKQNEELTEKERGKAKGGAIGDAAGSIAGAAAGTVAGGLLAAMATSAIAGTAMGTAIPGLGNIAGLIIGAGVGAAGYYLGGKLGRAGGEGIGGAMSANDGEGEQSSVYRGGSAKIAAMRRAGRYRMYADDLPPQITQTGNTIAPQKVELDGQAVMNVNVNLTGERPSASVAIQNNTTPFYFNTGSAVEARGVR
jgi:hypothetical protein